MVLWWRTNRGRIILSNSFEKKLQLLNTSSDEQYTLTVVTDPVSATCTLTVDGVSSSTKSLTVDAGTVISYSIYHATYGTTTGSITMNANKTLSCTGTYSTTETETSWSRPNLSSDGTIGSSSVATYASTVYGSYNAYRAVDGNSSTYWYGRGTVPYYWIFYSPTPVKITQMVLSAHSSGKNGYYQAQAFQIQGSTDNSNYTTLFTHSDTSRPATVTATLSPAGYYNYYRLYITTAAISSIASIYLEITMTGTQKTTSYTYYWNKTVTNT